MDRMSQTYRRKTGSATTAGGLQTGRGRPDSGHGLGIGKTIGVPGLRTTEIISVGRIVERRVQALKTRGIVASHGVLVQVDGHGTVSVELAGRLTMQRLLVALRAGRTGRGIVLIHIRGLLITHGDQQDSEFPAEAAGMWVVELMLRERERGRGRERTRESKESNPPQET